MFSHVSDVALGMEMSGEIAFEIIWIIKNGKKSKLFLM